MRSERAAGTVARYRGVAGSVAHNGRGVRAMAHKEGPAGADAHQGVAATSYAYA